jgi:hypothetical protein
MARLRLDAAVDARIDANQAPGTTLRMAFLGHGPFTMVQLL